MTVKHLKILHQHNSSITQVIKKDGDDVIQGLMRTPKSLPAKYFYDNRGSELFEQICDLP